MFDRLFELVGQFIGAFRFIDIVDAFEEGVVLRLGKYRMTVGPGKVWLRILYIDKLIVDNVVTTTLSLKEQVLTTADNKSIIISVMIRWRIRDIKKILLETEGGEAVLTDCAMGEVAQYVKDNTLQELFDADASESLYRAIRKRGWRFGIEVEEVQVTDFATTRVIRLIM